MLSTKQLQIYKFIRGVLQSTGQAPSNAEICRHFQIKSSASVHDHIVALEREGLIKRVPNESRGIVLTGEPEVAGVVLPGGANRL